MCNDYRLLVDLAFIIEEFACTSIEVQLPEGAPNVESREDIRITDMAPIVRSTDGQRRCGQLVKRRWSWPSPKGKPVYNFRSEGRDVTSHRCLILADGFYEFTDPTDPAQKRLNKWLFTMRDHSLFCIAGIWRESALGEAFTMLTMEAGPDVVPYHHRQIIPLARDQWADWLDESVPATEVLRWLPSGSLNVTQVYGEPSAQGQLTL
jgi:Uncharacterized conserved protein